LFFSSPSPHKFFGRPPSSFDNSQIGCLTNFSPPTFRLICIFIFFHWNPCFSSPTPIPSLHPLAPSSWKGRPLYLLPLLSVRFDPQVFTDFLPPPFRISPLQPLRSLQRVIHGPLSPSNPLVSLRFSRPFPSRDF